MIAEELNVALLQTSLVWHTPEANRKHIANLIEHAAASDIAILPEMFTTGFTMQPETFAETLDGETVTWAKQLAKKHNIAICGSIITTESNMYYNTFICVTPEEQVHYYHKRHTFTLAGEDKVYTKGIKNKVITYKGWRIKPQVCYDLRFPVWARNIEDYDVLLYVANWPNKRITAWDTLLKARAIENMSYCVGVNRIGLDENGHEYTGHSAVYDVLGNRLAYTEKEEIITVTLHKKEITTLRNRFHFLDDRDEFTLET